MIFENEHERLAFEFVYELASQATDRICNDLETSDRKKFEGLLVPVEDRGKIVMEPIRYDFDVLFWLKSQVKK